jgi:hypothetical protein
LRHVSKIATRTGSLLPVRVSQMTSDHAKYWDEHVQVRIGHRRADKGWRWPLIRLTALLGGSALLQRPRAFVVGIESGLRFQPCIMLLLVERYPALHDRERDSVFVWYLSPAPTSYFTQHLHYPEEDSPRESHLMAVGMDVAITHSYNCGLSGLVGLHADKSGGGALMQWYQAPQKGGMSVLPKTRRLPFGLRRVPGNDGRYFYHDESTARSASDRMDFYR